MIVTQLLICSTCKKELPRDRFRNNRRSKTGKQNLCRGCHSEASRVWRENNQTREHNNVMARHRRDRIAISAFKRRGQEQQIRRIGGPVSESYATLRRTAQFLQQAIDEQADPGVRAHLRAAMARLHEAEDELITALRLT